MELDHGQTKFHDAWPTNSADRAEKAGLVVVNWVVFRSSDQNLTLPGTVIEMASRIGEPVLLGLAALAVRSRVKHWARARPDRKHPQLLTARRQPPAAQVRHPQVVVAELQRPASTDPRSRPKLGLQDQRPLEHQHRLRWHDRPGLGPQRDPYR
ncbi:hypothetical protein [Kitasatospora sp. NPDC059571]|uniref:hypothetical protein n=1 Tax=Kitasatospora sp. NPDC059571 TaxID=3346871 RepID=UPI0036870F4B